MEQLILFAVIILFSILDSIAKKKRRGEVEGEAEADAEAWHGLEEGVSAYEPPTAGDPDGDGIPGALRAEYTGSYGDRDTATPASSEAMVPSDLWEEIGALARGERRPDPEPEPWDVPAPEPETVRQERPSRIPATSPIGRREVGVREVGSHPVHRSHAEYGTDPSERTPVPEPRRAGPSREVRAVRRALVGGGASEARKAVILHEVLGKPLAYRDEGQGGAEG